MFSKAAFPLALPSQQGSKNTIIWDHIMRKRSLGMVERRKLMSDRRIKHLPVGAPPLQIIPSKGAFPPKGHWCSFTSICIKCRALPKNFYNRQAALPVKPCAEFSCILLAEVTRKDLDFIPVLISQLFCKQHPNFCSRPTYHCHWLFFHLKISKYNPEQACTCAHRHAVPNSWICFT